MACRIGQLHTQNGSATSAPVFECRAWQLCPGDRNVAEERICSSAGVMTNGIVSPMLSAHQAPEAKLDPGFATVQVRG